jgi:hypothetical protein
MTAEEFNKLPLDARQYIEKQKPCCGRSTDLDALYKSFLIMKKTELFLLRTGAINYKTANGDTGILYPIHPKDTEDQVKDKLKTALAVNGVSPDSFEYIQADKIEKILGETEGANDKKVNLPKVNADGVPVDKNGKPLTGGPLKNALQKLEEAKADPAKKFEGKDGVMYETEQEALDSIDDDLV